MHKNFIHKKNKYKFGIQLREYSRRKIVKATIAQERVFCEAV